MNKTLILLVCLFLLSGCAGPAYPEKDGRQYLKQRGYSSEQIDAIVNGWKLDPSLVRELMKSKSADVRFLVARNPNLTKEQINFCMKDKDDFARSGVARNTSLSPDQIEILTFDPSHTVYCKLAANESLSESTLLRIYKERKPGLLWFAQNPNCPDTIRKEILRSGDSLTKQWLRITDNWKKCGVYVKGKDGRWRKPLKQPKAQTQTQDNIKGYKAGYAAEINHVTIDAGFIPDKTKIILGQPLFITFTVANKSKFPYKFFIGGDNRGSVRHNNFRITATDAHGKPVKDPYSYDNHGGMGNDIVLKHCEKYNERLFLNLWCAFAKPGIYTVTCQRTLREYGKKPRRMPISVKSSFKLTIEPFSKKQMSDVIVDLGRKLRDGKPQDLYEASLALSTIADEQIIPHLALSLTRGNFRNKLPAIRGLSQFSVNAAANALVAALKAPDYVVRDAAGNALRNIKKTDYALQLLLPGLNDKSSAIRALTAQSLGILKNKEAYDPLLKATHDHEPAVRYAAATGLGTLGCKDALQPLKRYLEDKDMGMRIAAVRGLLASGEQLDPQWLVPVIRATSDLNDQNLHEAIRLTRLYGGKNAASALVSCLNFDDPSPRNTRNMFLILAIHYSSGGPQYYYKFYSNPNVDGTPKQIEQNRKILAALKKWLQDKH